MRGLVGRRSSTSRISATRWSPSVSDAAQRATRPRPSVTTITSGGDTRITFRAWCDSSAGSFMRPSVHASGPAMNQGVLLIGSAECFFDAIEHALRGGLLGAKCSEAAQDVLLLFAEVGRGNDA